MRVYLFLSGLVILLSSCASTNNNYSQTIHSWNGGNVTALTQRWGAPDGKMISPTGNTYYVYRTVSYENQRVMAPTEPTIGVHTSPGGNPIVLTTSGGASNWNRGMPLSCTAIFEVNKAGTIVDTKIVGTSCYGGQAFSEKLGNPANNQ